MSVLTRSADAPQSLRIGQGGEWLVGVGVGVVVVKGYVRVDVVSHVVEEVEQRTVGRRADALYLVVQRYVCWLVDTHKPMRKGVCLDE